MTNKKTAKRTALAALALMLGLSTGAWADAVPTNDADSLTIRITPNVDLGVDIDTTTTRFNEGDSGGDLDVTLALNSTYYFVSPASVTIQGNFAKQELQVTGAKLDTWTLDSDEAIGTDSVQLYALFTTDNLVHPAEAEFALNGTRNLIIEGSQNAGQATGDEGTPDQTAYYERAAGVTSPAQMDDMAPGALRQLWLRLDTPAASNETGVQRFLVTLTAISGTTN